jgi:hypothetical protein
MTPECAIEILKVRKIKYCNPDESDAWKTLQLAATTKTPTPGLLAFIALLKTSAKVSTEAVLDMLYKEFPQIAE